MSKPGSKYPQLALAFKIWWQNSSWMLKANDPRDAWKISSSPTEACAVCRGPGSLALERFVETQADGWEIQILNKGAPPGTNETLKQRGSEGRNRPPGNGL